MTSVLIKHNVSYPHNTNISLNFCHFARILTFYDYWHSKTRIWLDFECLSSSHHQTLKIRIMIRMRITNILYESTRVRTTNPSKPQKDSRIRRIYSNYESSNINTRWQVQCVTDMWNKPESGRWACVWSELWGCITNLEMCTGFWC